MRQFSGRLCQQGQTVFHGLTFTHGTVEGRDKDIDAGLADLCPIAHSPGNSHGQPLRRSLAETLRHTDRGLTIHRLRIDASLAGHQHAASHSSGVEILEIHEELSTWLQVTAQPCAVSYTH